MEYHEKSSQTSIDRKCNTFKHSIVTLINEQNEIDDFIQHGILDAIVEYDPKLDFICSPIVTQDQVLKHIHRQIYGLIWNSIRLPIISKLVRYDQSCAFVQILRVPTKWSRYDTDLLLLKIQQKNFLNGLALRDEFVRVLQIILKRDFNQGTNTKPKYPYELKTLDFTRNVVRLVFNSRKDTQLTHIISLVLLVEFDIPCTEFFPDTYTSLCHHDDLSEYLNHHPDMKLTRLTPYNSIKFRFDYSLTEAKLCEYLLQNPNRLSLMLTNFLKLRKQWLKYVQRAARYSTETSRMQIHPDKYRSSISSMTSIKSDTSESMENAASLSKEIELAFESIFSISLLRLLFLTVCSKYKPIGSEHDNNTVYAIGKALQLFINALENNYLEHPFLQNANSLPDFFLSNEMRIRIGIKKIVIEMQREWKKTIRS